MDQTRKRLEGYELNGHVTFWRSHSSGGHRSHFYELFPRIFLEAGCSVESQKFELSFLWRRGLLYSSMIEDHPGVFFFVALFRSMISRQTTGILFIPKPCLSPINLRYKCKAMLLRLCRASAFINILSLVPFFLDDRLSQIADDWIFDPQMWDLPEPQENDVNCIGEDIRQILELSDSRPIMLAIGRQSQAKGTIYLTEIWSSSTSLRSVYRLVIAGVFDTSILSSIDILKEKDAEVVNRFISDCEIQALSEMASAIWCVYDPLYDQASGIFGRAFQLNKRCVVRTGSLLDRLAEVLEVDVWPIDWAAASDAIGSLLICGEFARPAYRGGQLGVWIREFSREKILGSVGQINCAMEIE